METKRTGKDDLVFVSEDEIRSYQRTYDKSLHLKAMANALSKNSIPSVTFVQASTARNLPKFSIDIPTLPVTNQKKSGRCWLFAGLNLLREQAAKVYNLKEFELSQNYTAFWDKFEKINYFLECMIRLIDVPREDRRMGWLLGIGMQDGGQWDMLAGILEKYGVVPKDAMAETYQSSNTSDLNRLINTKLRQYTVRLRSLRNKGAEEEELRKEKKNMLEEMYGFLCANLGVPPTKFDFEYVDREGTYHILRDQTPKGFMESFAGGLVTDSVSVIHSPTEDKPYYATYTVDYLGSVIEGKPIRYLNLPMEEMKDLILRQLKDGNVVWFGSDVGKYGDREAGVWDDQAYDYDTAFCMDFSMEKDERLEYSESAMNHAMVITGVNLDEEGKPTRWKIQNSWGDEHGEKGYYLMSASWFDTFVYQAVILKKYLTQAQQEALEKEPVHLNPWDPMGALAK